MSDSSGTLKLAGYLMVGGGVCVYRGLKRLRKLREIEDTPCSEIRTAAQGLVEIEGHALPYREMFKNSAEKDVVFYSIKFEQLVSSGKSSRWVTVHEETLGGLFIVSDGTGIGLVDVAKADFLLRETTRDWRKVPDDEREVLISRFGSAISGLFTGSGGFFRSRFRVTEKYLLDGGPVYIRGAFRTPAAEMAYTISPLHFRFLEKLALLKKVPGGGAKAFDLNRDGKIEEAELSKGSEKLLYLSRHAVLTEDRPEAVAIQGLLYFDAVHGLTIGDSYQQQLTAKLSSWNAVRIIGGAVLIAGGVGVLAERFF